MARLGGGNRMWAGVLLGLLEWAKFIMWAKSIYFRVIYAPTRASGSCHNVRFLCSHCLLLCPVSMCCSCSWHSIPFALIWLLSACVNLINKQTRTMIKRLGGKWAEHKDMWGVLSEWLQKWNEIIPKTWTENGNGNGQVSNEETCPGQKDLPTLTHTKRKMMERTHTCRKKREIILKVKLPRLSNTSNQWIYTYC